MTRRRGRPALRLVSDEPDAVGEAARAPDRSGSREPGPRFDEWPFPHVREAPAAPGYRTLVVLDDAGHEFGHITLPRRIIDAELETLAAMLQAYRDRAIPRRTLRLHD